VTSVVLDTHALYWWAVEPERLSRRAADALEAADELVVAAASWWELAWLLGRHRLSVRTPLRSWLAELAAEVRTAPLTPGVAASAAELPASFPRDPVDRLIAATSIEAGLALVTKDHAIRTHPATRDLTVW
jgi:PIN domain nuclease of toxin-antitoxin system